MFFFHTTRKMSSLRTTIKNKLHGEMYMAHNSNRLYFHFQTMVFIKMYITIFFAALTLHSIWCPSHEFIFSNLKKRTKHTTFSLHFLNWSVEVQTLWEIGSWISFSKCFVLAHHLYRLWHGQSDWFTWHSLSNLRMNLSISLSKLWKTWVSSK